MDSQELTPDPRRRDPGRLSCASNVPSLTRPLQAQRFTRVQVDVDDVDCIGGLMVHQARARPIEHHESIIMA